MPGKINQRLERTKNMEIQQAIETRKSVRRYTSEPVDDKLVEKVLNAACRAPSWKNNQCWRFIVVRDSDVKNALAETLLKIQISTGTGDNPAAKAIRSAPVVIVACAELGKSGFTSGVPDTDKGDWYMFDVALAMENLALSAHELGLGTVIVGAFDAGKTAEILEIPEGSCAVVMTPLGYPDHERQGKITPRKNPSELVFREKYGRQ